MDIYRRIYRLANKKIPASQIAMTLGLPLSNVKEILKKLDGTSAPIKKAPKKIDDNATTNTGTDYLDIYIFQQSRSTVVDLTGFAVDKHRIKLKVELNRVDRGDPKTVALMLKNLKSLDETCYKLLHEFYKDYISRGRFCAFLDPSPEIEVFIDENNVEDDVPVFGTLSALEIKAFSVA